MTVKLDQVDHHAPSGSIKGDQNDVKLYQHDNHHGEQNVSGHIKMISAWCALITTWIRLMENQTNNANSGIFHQGISSWWRNYQIWWLITDLLTWCACSRAQQRWTLLKKARSFCLFVSWFLPSFQLFLKDYWSQSRQNRIMENFFRRVTTQRDESYGSVKIERLRCIACAFHSTCSAKPGRNVLVEYSRNSDNNNFPMGSLWRSIGNMESESVHQESIDTRIFLLKYETLSIWQTVITRFVYLLKNYLVLYFIIWF